MRTALDRLLARPSTLRLLRRIAATRELPRIAPRRHLSARWPTHDQTHNGVREKQESEDDAMVSKDKLLRDNIRKTIQEKMHTTSWQESDTQPKPDAAGEDLRVWIEVEAWTEILQRMQRIHGSDGVKVAWEMMREEQVDIPTAGPHADAIWGLLIAEEGLLDSVVSYAFDLKARTGQAYEKLYEGIIASFFARQQNAPIYEWHGRLIQDFPPGPGGLKMIASHIIASKGSYSAFRWIYYRNNQRDVYDTIIPALQKQGKLSMARNLQVWLLSRGDIPKGSRPVEELVDMSKTPSLSRGRYSRKKTAQDALDPFDTTAVYVRQLETIGMRPKKVDDEFCARLFATRALTINFATNCILMMDCDEIGPLSMREMAFRSSDCKTVVENIGKIVDAGMAIKNTTYCRAIMRFALQNNQDLLQSLLETDQHPDNFDDEVLQHKLLKSYIRANDRPGIRRTLAMLTISKLNAESEGWNIMVRTVSDGETGPWNNRMAALSHLLEEGEMRGFKISRKTLGVLQQQLRPRKPAHAPQTLPEPGVHDDIWFTNVCCLALKTGTKVEPFRWRELFRRFGMTERFDHVYHLALWLANFYMTTHNLPEDLLRDFNHHFNPDRYCLALTNSASRGPEPRQPTDLRPSQPGHPLREIFNGHQLRAFVAWSIRRDFILPHNPNRKRKHFWARGLVLLRMLRQNDVCVSVHDVRKELNTQLVRLFGRHDPLLRRNLGQYHRARRNNPYTLAEMVQQANEAYGSFPEGVSEEPLLDLDKTRKLVLAAYKPPLWRHQRWPRRKKAVGQTAPPNMDLWSQLRL